MEAPVFPSNENQRLQALRTLQILDTDPEERFDRITRMAKRLFGVSISLVSLVDSNRQWFKSKQGLDICETGRDISFCGHAILGHELFVIENTLEDPRFADNPLVTGEPHIRFYASCPLKAHSGYNIGTLCLIDTRPRVMDESDKQLLADLGTMVEKEFTAIQMTTLDAVTLISNKRGFMALAEHTLNVCRRKRLMASLVLFRITNFHMINEKKGTENAEMILKCFAQTMESVFRESDILTRLSGGEFAILLTDNDPEQVDNILVRFSDKLIQFTKTFNIDDTIAFKSRTVHFAKLTDITADEMLDNAFEMMT